MIMWDNSNLFSFHSLAFYFSFLGLNVAVFNVLNSKWNKGEPYYGYSWEGIRIRSKWIRKYLHSIRILFFFFANFVLARLANIFLFSQEKDIP